MGIMGKSKANKKEVKVEPMDDDEIEDEVLEEEETELICDETTQGDELTLKTYLKLSEERAEKIKHRSQLDREIRQIDKDLERAHNREIKSARKNRKNNISTKG